MKKFPTLECLALTVCSMTGSIATISAAPINADPASPTIALPSLQSAPLFLETSLTTSYTAPSDVESRTGKKGDSDATEVKLGVRGGAPINSEFTWNWGVSSENFFLDTVEGVPIPEDINTIHLMTGLGYRLNGQWSLNALVGTSLYRFEDIDSDTFGFYGGMFATYRANPSLTFNFGLMISPDSDLPVFPAAGVHWLIDERFTLEFGVPKTRLSYRLDPKWTLYTGLDTAGTTFKTSKSFSDELGTSRYDDALASYRDVRVGAGARWQVINGLRAELEAGASVYRRIDYKDLDEEVEFDPAPYVRLGLNYRF